MDGRGLQATILVVVIVVSVYAGLVYMGGFGPSNLTRHSNVTSIEICGNTTDILYPELMDAKFAIQSPGEWLVTASFVNDSLGPYNLTTYDRTFITNTSEVENINTALYDALNLTYSSNDSITDALNNTSIAFDLLIYYEDGTWVHLCALLNAKGHILFNEGQGTADRNLLAGRVLESWFVLDKFIQAVNQVFTSHLG